MNRRQNIAKYVGGTAMTLVWLIPLLRLKLPGLSQPPGGLDWSKVSIQVMVILALTVAMVYVLRDRN